MLTFTPKFRKNLRRIIPFGFIWLIIGWVTLWTEYAVISTMPPQNLTEAAIVITPKIVLFASISVFFTGCLVGFLEVTFINQYFVKSSFPKKLVSKFLIYGILMFFTIFFFYILAASIEMQQSVFSDE